jgi:hypothetical protein
MPTWRITEIAEPNLSSIFGLLTGEQRGRILSQIAAADAKLSETAEALRAQGETEWKWEGVLLTIADSGQISIDALLEEASKGRLTFVAQLRPRNFFPTEVGMWQPGKAPLVMATDAWDVDGMVAVRFKTRVTGRPYTIQQSVVELEEQRYDDPAAAIDAFAANCAELAELALSREATVDAWKPSGQSDASAGPAPAASI